MEEELLMEYGLIKFKPDMIINEQLFELVRAKAFFSSYSYEEALSFYNEQKESVKENIYMSTGSDALVYYDTEYTYISINPMFLIPEYNFELIDIIRANRDKSALSALQLAPNAVKLLIYRMLLSKNMISAKEKREALIYVYCSSEYNFDKHFYLDQFISTKDKAEDLLDLYSKLNIDENDYVTIYRGEGSKSTDVKDALSWTLDLKTAYFFKNRFTNEGGKLYKATIKLKDILAYIANRNEEEIIVDFIKLHHVKELVD